MHMSTSSRAHHQVSEASTRRSLTTTRIGATALALAVLSIGGIAAAAPSQAGACSETGGENNRLMWTGKSYTCAYVASSGNKSIGFAQTKTWTSNTAMGYSKRYNCDGQTGGVTVKYVYTDSAGTNLGSSITYTAINTSDGDRHWHAAVLWNTSKKAGSVADDQFLHNCSTDKSIGVQQFYQSKLTLTGPSSFKANEPTIFTATVKNPDGGPAPTGRVYLFSAAKSNVMNPPAKDCAGNETNTTKADVPLAYGDLVNGAATLVPPQLVPKGYQFYAVYGGYPLTSQGLAAHCLTPPQSTGLTPAQSNLLSVTARSASDQVVAPTKRVPLRGDIAIANPRLTVVNRSATAPSLVAGHCPVGKVPVQLSLASPTEPLDPDNLRRGGNGASIATTGLPAGTEVDLQLVCRPAKASAAVLPGISWGSVKNDTFVTNRAGGALFGGLGNDNLTIVNAKGGGWGGPGRDTITLRANGSAASGGPGADRLVSTAGGKSLLSGGPGKDVMIGAKGATVINALDGHGGDKIYCKSRRNVVYLDAGDRTFGPCTVRQG